MIKSFLFPGKGSSTVANMTLRQSGPSKSGAAYMPAFSYKAETAYPPRSGICRDAIEGEK